MTTAPTLGSISGLREFYNQGSEHLHQHFRETADGHGLLAERTALVEKVLLRLWQGLISPGAPEPAGFALVAIGGFGRRWLFPHSDIDLLFLHAGRETEVSFKDRTRRFSQELWDLRMKLSPTTRTLAECDHFDVNNIEFTMSLLDCRYLAGDRAVFESLRENLIPKLIAREAQTLVQRLVEVTRDRHGKYGSTVFHLEPNVKETPGGLRDYNVTNWLPLISAIDRQRAWPGVEEMAAISRQQLRPAVDFLVAARCFLHLRNGRDDNLLSWEAQDEAAARKIGATDQTPTPAAWMRIYFNHARTVNRNALQVLDEIPAGWSSLYRQFQNWRSRLSNSEFSVVHGMLYFQQPSAARDPQLLLRLFDFMAHHDLKLSRATEHRIEQVLPEIAADPLKGSDVWLSLQVLLLEPHAAEALRAMHSLGLLTILLPEWKSIDSLVVRDFYHRFTVDEHSFLTIECLHGAKQSPSEWDRRYGQILEELEQPELLYLSLLLHDVGKGAPTQNHVIASLEVAENCLERFELSHEARETVRFLIGSHLEMSATLRRDVFDPQTIAAFAEKVGTPERLKMLCLLTYADIKAVNPEALTPWKAEAVWQLYISTTNFLNHSVDQRVHWDVDDANLARLRTLAPAMAKKIKPFLDGLPKRYLRSYSAEDILHHFEMAGQLSKNAVQLDLKRGRHWYELTLVTADRPFLFSTMSGVLAAWGMNIVKANAFSNDAGTVLDTFYFTDTFRTLELNLPEWERFKRSIADVLAGEADLDRMLQNRIRPYKNSIAKVKIKTEIEFDDHAPASSTLVQVIAPDRPGLLHRISSRFAYQGCNIEIALIDTEGQMAIDVFYITAQGRKLTAEHHAALKADLMAELQAE